MNRREAGRALVMGTMGTIAVALPAAVLAQGMPGLGAPETEHATDTLKVGGLALKTSQLAQSKAKAFRVVEFAEFEVAEQTMIAQIIQEATGMAPPAPDARDQATLAAMQRLSGKAFEAGYVAAQIDGHNKLLAIQERYLATGRNADFRHVAMLARGQIKEHLKLLSDIRSGRA